MAEFVHQERVNNIMKFYNPTGSCNFSAFNGGFWMSIWARDSTDNKPMMSLFLSREIQMMILRKAKKFELLNESKGTFFELRKREGGMGPEGRSVYMGTIRLERDEGNHISIGASTPDHKDMQMFPLSFSHIDSIRPDGHILTPWQKNVMGLKTFIGELEGFVKHAIFHTAMFRLPQETSGSVPQTPSPNSYSTGDGTGGVFG